MALDERVGNPVARAVADHGMLDAVGTRSVFTAMLALAACGPAVHPQGPGEPGSAAAAPAKKDAGAAPHATAPPAITRQALVGEMCPQGAAGRPGVLPLFLRGLDWSDDPADVGEPLARGQVHQLAVLGEDGRRAGVFTVMGTADVGIGADVAIGSYAGASPCARPPQTNGAAAKDDPACVAATHGCALAIAAIVPGEDAFSGPAATDEGDVAPAPPVGAACIAGDTLVVDIDGDGAAETYSLPAFLDPVRAPADEVSAVPTASPPCQGSFARWDARVDAGADPGAAADPKYKVEIDLVGVVDVDGDGRKELFVAFRYPDRRTLAVYSATTSAGRLERVGEVMPWQTTP